MYGAVRCPACGAFMYPGTSGRHECNPAILERFQMEQAAAELRDDNAAATLELWRENATRQPIPDEDHATVSLPARRAFAEYLREKETPWSEPS